MSIGKLFVELTFKFLTVERLGSKHHLLASPFQQYVNSISCPLYWVSTKGESYFDLTTNNQYKTGIKQIKQKLISEVIIPVHFFSMH